MAGDWIKMRTNLDTDPRVIQIAFRLDIPELQVVGCLWKLWAWADAHTLDGNAVSVTDVTLDRFTCVTGFAQALREVGWLEGENGALSFPRFAEHNGKTAKKRATTRDRVNRSRQNCNADSVTDVTHQALTEKRREEKSITNTHALPSSNGSLARNGDEGERAGGAFDEPMNAILRAAGFRRPHWSASEYAEFAAHPQLLTDPEAVSTIVGAVGGWKTSQESGDGRRVPVSAKEIGRRLPEIWDWADTRSKARPSSRRRYLTRDEMMKP